jgi:hypothetical protein
MKSPGAWWGATVGAVLAYTTTVLVSFPPPVYFFPRLGSWGFLALPGEVPIRWYGWLIDSAVGGLFGVVVGRFIRRRPPWALVWPIAVTSLLALAWHERLWFTK